jgi:ankyrin repeat protein
MPLGLAAATNDLSGLLQKGLFEEEANRNLEAAAQAYSTVSAQFDKDRKLAATAIFRLGEIYRKQGKTNEAAGQYERIVREFADQDTLVTLSRQNLVGLGKIETKPTAVTAGDTLANLENEYQLLKLQLETAKNSGDPYVPARLFDDVNLKQALDQHYQLMLQRGTNQSASELREKQKQALERANVIMTALYKEKESQLSKLESAIQLERAGVPVSSSFIDQVRKNVGNRSGGNNANTTDDEEKEIRRIQAMIQNSPDLINARGSDVDTPLTLAASKGQLGVVRFLLEHGAGTEVTGAFDETPLVRAAAAGHMAIVELLLSKGANVNAQAGKGLTALHNAANFGFMGVAEVLLEKKAEIEACDKSQSTPLHLAAANGHAEMIRLLIKRGANPDAVNGAGYTPLIWAAQRGQTASVATLLAAKANPDIEDKEGRTALSNAAGNGHIESVRALLAAKADPNAGKAGAALFWAISKPECVKLLLEAGAIPNMKKDGGQTPLLTAVEKGYYESAVLLIQHGADVNVANDKRMTPLQMAVWSESIPMVSLLLTNHAEVNAPGPAGRNALIMAEEAMNGSRPYKPGDYGGSGLAPNPPIARKTAALLREYGGLSDLPKFDRIEVRRPEAHFASTVFVKSTNDWNQFTLLDALFAKYFAGTFIANPGSTATNFIDRIARGSNELPFPDLRRIVVVRQSAEAGKPTKRIPVDLILPTGGVDCAKDMPLEFGDVVEIPEREHTLQDGAVGIAGGELQQMARCREGTVGLLVRGKRTELKVWPIWQQASISQVLQRSEIRSALFSSSDLSRVKVTRQAGASTKLREWLVDCSGGNNPDLWLRDGDVIEVPDKP